MSEDTKEIKPCENWVKCPYKKSVYEDWDKERYERRVCKKDWTIYDDELT